MIAAMAIWPARAVEGQSTPASGRRDLSAACATCHECPVPTSAAPCLRTCSRATAMAADGVAEVRTGPLTVILGELTNRYLPVPFDHAGHASMANMTRGCVVCHHHTPQGQEHPSCKTCHALEPGIGDIHMPGLKGAYHRQCMNCHVEWSGDTHCGICHQPRTGGVAAVDASAPSKDDIIGRMHPPIPEPEVREYVIASGGAEPSRVLFRHKRHIEAYGLGCADCHHESSCVRCHARPNGAEPRVKPFSEHHQPCFACHANNSCESCHYGEKEPPPPMFDHARTGWPLSRHHRASGCRDCHPTAPYRSPATDCRACHKDWAPGAFDHAITGQTLDEVHAAIDCAECHAHRRFDQPPTCDECHDADSGIGFPVRRPGPVKPTNP